MYSYSYMPYAVHSAELIENSLFIAEYIINNNIIIINIRNLVRSSFKYEYGNGNGLK